MLFDVEADTGETISGYCVPDSYTARPRLALTGGGRLLWSGEGEEARPALVAAGRHADGRCGFRIGPGEVPGLAGVTDAELRDLDTGLLLYRRRTAPHGVRLFRVETGILGCRGFDLAMDPAFQGWFAGLERQGAETVDQVLHLSGMASVYGAGRVHPAAHPALAAGRFRVMVCLRDPVEELATRLRVLAGAYGPPERALTLREERALEPALAALDGRAGAGPREMRRLVRRLPEEAAAALSNPLSRQLSTAVPGTPCGPGAVSAALRTLAAADLVAVPEAEPLARLTLAAMTGSAPPIFPEPDPAVPEIAAELEGLGAAEALLDCDLEVYANVSSVLDRLAQAGTGSTAASGAAVLNSL